MSSEDLKSLIVTDPDIVDEGIDISGLRTQTDTNPRLLASIADFPGISYDPTSFDYLSDLNELFAYGLPEIDTSEAVTPPVTTAPDTGGEGQATLPGFEDTTPEPINTPEDQRLIDEGIGLQIAPGQPVFAPGEMPVTQEEIDNFNFPALTQENTADDIMKDFQYQSLKEDLSGRNLVDEVALTGEEQSTIQNIIGQAGQTVEGALTQLGKIPGAIVDKAKQTVDIFGKKLNVGKTLASLAINKIAGAPVSLILEALPERDPRQNALDEFYDVKNGIIQSGIMKGYSPVSGGFPGISEPNYGLQEAYDKRINNTRNTLQEKYGLTNEELDSIEAGNITDAIKQKAISDEMSIAYGKPTTSNLVANLAELSDLKAREKDVIDAATTGAPQEDIGAISGDTGADPITGDLPGGGNIVDEFAPSDDKDDSPAPSTPSVNEADVEAGLATESISDFVDDFEVSGEAAPITGISGADSFFDAVDTATGGGGDRDDDSGPSAPTGPPSGGFQSESTYDAEEEDETPADRGGGNGGSSSGGGGCVIATHAVNSGAFTKDTKREAVRWCVKNLHRTWWGEAIRRGYRYYGQKAIEEGKAKNHYQEFKDYVAFGTGKRRTLKTTWTFVYRTIQFFIRGLFNAK